ncbi:YbaN family protein [Acinetobacter pittii]|uniref:YbaN family protein n=1 Tax=Acinetobacter pittii TaxID=48296 RepID=UPI002FF32979
MRTLFWRSLVVIFITLGIIGAILPGMPTTVFLILAAWAASKGWPQMDDWLLNHPKYGPTLRDWRANGTVPRKAKWIASIMMAISGLIMLFTSAPLWVMVFTDTIMFIVAVWLWLRPEPKLKD